MVCQKLKQPNWSYDFAKSMKENIVWPITSSMLIQFGVKKMVLLLIQAFKRDLLKAMKVNTAPFAAFWGLWSLRFADVNLVYRVLISFSNISDTKNQVET